MQAQSESKNWEKIQAIWAKWLFAASFVVLGVTVLLYGIGVFQLPEGSAAKQKPVSAGGLRCETPVWDFGSIDSVRNPRLSHEFVVNNVSQETVSIIKIHSSCGCMVAEGYDEELAPGQSTKLQVNIQLPTPPQRVHHDLAVQTNKGVLPLRVTGEIAANSNMFSMPSVVHFGTINLGESNERTVQIFRHDLSTIDYVGVEANSESVVYTVQQEETSSCSIKLTFTVCSDGAATGYFEDTIKIITNHRENPDYSLRVRVTVINSQKDDL